MKLSTLATKRANKKVQCYYNVIGNIREQKLESIMGQSRKTGGEDHLLAR